MVDLARVTPFVVMVPARWASTKTPPAKDCVPMSNDRDNGVEARAECRGEGGRVRNGESFGIVAVDVSTE